MTIWFNITNDTSWLNITNNTSTNLNSSATLCRPWSKLITIVFTIDMVIAYIAVLLNIIGACILLQRASRRRGLSNQKIFLLNLSFSSVLNVATNVWASYYQASCEKNRDFRIFFITFYIVYFVYIGNLLLLTGDRALFVWFLLRYNSIFTRIYAYISLFIMWVIAVGYGMLVDRILLKIPVYWKFESYVYNGFVVLFTLVVYSYIGVTASRSSRRVQTRDTNKPSGARINKKIWIPLYIALSFFLFQTAPPIIADAISYDKSRQDYDKVVVLILLGVNMLNNISDPATYIILSRK